MAKDRTISAKASAPNLPPLVSWNDALARPGQLLKDHSFNVSNLASLFASKFGATELLKSAGYLHDLGKLQEDFQKYMSDENAERGSVQHAVFGAKRVFADIPGSPAVAELLGNIIAAHHGRLYDNISPVGDTPLTDKLGSAATFPMPPGCPDFDAEAMTSELACILSAMPNNERAFGMTMFTKPAYSCLVDADRTDAFLSESGESYSPKKPDWGDMLAKLELRLEEFETQSEMSALRRQVSEACAGAGSRGIGIYKLEVPTGGGKTLSSLRFALEHARRHTLDRIIYVIPYLSILSQAADEIRRALALEPDNETVLEHHSNFLPDDPRYYKLHTDRWDSPIILTTQVQFLESLFSAGASDLRKLHNMSRSVLIFDEVQSLPIKCVYLFNSAINFLHHVCGSTALLCTATQPCLDNVKHKILFSESPSIVTCGKTPERTNIVFELRPSGYSYPDLAEFVLKKHGGSTLVIVNTKLAAKLLYEELKSSSLPVLHLSTNMCAAHRDDVLNELKRRLKEPVICVSTQLIEAGVDLSVGCVIRDIAGLDSIYQAAGRCNRHGDFGEVRNVYVINIAGENLSKLPDIKTGAEITYRLNSENNLEINEYYRHYFYAREKIMNFPTRGNGSVYGLLSANKQGWDSYCKDRLDKRNVSPPAMRPAIRSAGEEFFVIDRGRTDVIVPYGNSEELVAQFISAGDAASKRGLLRKLGRYSVSLYKYQADELKRRAALNTEYELTTLARGFYDAGRGVDVEGHHEFLYL